MNQNGRIRQLRAQVIALEKALKAAGAKESETEKAHRCALQGDPAATELATHQLEMARRARQEAREWLRDAELELENAKDDEMEAAGNDDPLSPRTDYELKDIVAKLSQYRQRVTYRAVGQLCNAKPYWVRGWFNGRENPENSFIVSAVTGEPTNYEPGQLHPNLKQLTMILDDAAELLKWLQSHRVVHR